MLSTSPNRPAKWSAAEAKRARKEHQAAEKERLWVQEVYENDVFAEKAAEQAALQQLAAEVSSPSAVAAVIALPAALAGLAAACGFNPAATTLAVSVPFCALALAISTPFSQMPSRRSPYAKSCANGANPYTVATSVQAAVGLAAVLQLHVLVNMFWPYVSAPAPTEVESNVLPASTPTQPT